MVHRPDPVPSWADEGLAVAAPQAPAPTAGPVADWVHAVRSSVPDLGVLDELLVTGDIDALVAFADGLEAATMALRAVPDDGDGDRSTRVLLGFLLRAEAARLAATGEPPLDEAAAKVAAIASSPVLWHPALGPSP